MNWTAEKVYHGCVEPPSKHPEECIRKNEPLIITFEGRRMTILPEHLITKRQLVSQEFKGKKGGKPYRLWAYKWIPDVIEND